MFEINRLADYGMLAMNFLSEEPAAHFSAAQIAVGIHIAQPTVSKILKQLLNAGLLESSRGVNGGYRLARAPEAISMAQVIGAIDGWPAVTKCAKGENNCVHDKHCVLRANWQRINDSIITMLNQISLADLQKPLPASRIQPLAFYQEGQHE